MAMRLQAVGDGLADTAVARRMETLRPASEQSPSQLDRWATKVRGTLDWLEQQGDEIAADLTIGQVAVACALGYLDFRFGQEDFRPQHPRLAAWYAAFSGRPSMQATPHHAL
jgi:glutathione S-transferase